MHDIVGPKSPQVQVIWQHFDFQSRLECLLHIKYRSYRQCIFEEVKGREKSWEPHPRAHVSGATVVRLNTRKYTLDEVLETEGELMEMDSRTDTV
jgi:hypothetical protein